MGVEEEMKHVDKVWGSETWLVNEPEYCAKILHLNKGSFCSTHRHPVKKETFIVRKGLIELEVGSEAFSGKFTLYAGQQFTIIPKTWHRFYGVEDSEILEVSTHHRDSDVERMTRSGKLPETRAKVDAIR